MNIDCHTRKVHILEDIGTIMMIFVKILNTQCLQIRGKRSQLKSCDNSLLSSLSLLVKNIEEEIQSVSSRVDITRGWTLGHLQELIQ